MITIEPAETMAEYVQRKLKSPSVKLTQVAWITGIKLGTIYNIRLGKDSMYSNIQALHDFFKKSAD